MERALQQAEKFIMAEQYEDAITQLGKVLEETPDDVDALNDLGVAFFKQNDGLQALNTYLRAIELAPHQTVLWENLGEVVQEDGISRDRLRAAYRQLPSDQVAAPQRAALKRIGRKVPEVAYYRGAYAQCDITPKSACITQGWFGEQQAEKALSPLQLQALLLEDANNNQVLAIAADLFGVGETLLDTVRKVAREWGIPPEAIIFNVSHTHYAPGTVERVIPGLGPYYAQYATQIANAVQQLLAHLQDKMQPCFLYTGRADAQIGVNRRQNREDGSMGMAPNPEGYYHKDTPLLVLDLLDDQKTVAVVNHGCHPTGSGQPTFLSPGYPGYLRQKLVVDGVADGVMFLQGAAGSSKLLLNGEGEPRFAGSPAEAKACAGKLAEAAIACMEAELTAVRGPIFARLEQVSLSLEEALAREELERMPVSENGVQRVLEDKWAQHFLNGAEEPGETLDLEIQFVGLGEETGFLTFPGEPVAELARSVLDRVEIAKNTFILGYTNGLKAYLPTRQIVEEGGYESEAAKMVYLLPASFKATVEEEIISGVEQLVEHWRAPGRPNGYGRYHLLEEQGEAFFCLSTGRCGTKTLAHLLSTASNARVYHHPRPYLVEETLAAYQGEINRGETFWQAREGVIRDAWKDGLIFGETDHNMTAFAPAINDELESAKYIVLVRNPWDFVRSGMRRQYYKNHPWDSGRLRPSRQHPDYEAWEDMTPFEKVCWLWNETYRRISDFVEELPPEQYQIVQFEKLVDDSQVTAEIFEFLGLSGLDEAEVQRILGRKLNRQKQGSYERPTQWDDEKHKVLWSTCQSTIEQLGLTDYQAMYTSYQEGSNRAGATNGAMPSLDTNHEPETPGLRPDATEQPQITTTTVWDYKKFKYQAYPERITPSDIVAANSKRALINRKTPIASMGSCFARNVAKYLLGRDFNYLVTEQPFQQASAHWDQVFNTACMRQIFEYSLTDEWDPAVRWWPKGEDVQDPYRRDILYPVATCEEHFERHRAASRKAMQEAQVFILTLGLIETWRDKRDYATYYRVPSPSIYDPELHEFYVQTVQDCTQDLDVIHDLLAEANPAAQVVVTVSPVPLFATFRMDVDVVSANRLSKSTLRVAAEYFAQKHDNVHYFPAYEIVTQGMDDPYEEDNRHVTKETVARVMQAFESLYVV